MIADIEIEKYDLVKCVEWSLESDPHLKRAIKQTRRKVTVIAFCIGLLYCGLAWSWVLLFSRSSIIEFAAVTTIIWLVILIILSCVRLKADLVAKQHVESSPSRWATLFTPTHLEITDEGLRVTSDYVDGIRFWNSYSHAPLADTRLLLIQKDDSTLPVPKRCFGSDEAFAAFCNAIWNHLPQERPVSG